MFNSMLILVIVVILLSVTFDFINGFHDTANSIATVVSTRVLSPRAAIMMAMCLNFLGAFVNQNVAATVAKGIIDSNLINQYVIIAALLSAIIWNIATWYLGIPSSSSHALFGGMIGAAIVFTNGFSVVNWTGVLHKIIIPLFTSPAIGIILGFLFMKFLYLVLRPFTPTGINKVFSKLQILSAALMAFSHGNNDAQKSMGIITLALVAANMHGAHQGVPLWVIIICAVAMAAGTSIGGWKIIKTMGVSMIRLAPINGFAAETASAVVIHFMSAIGAPVSTTQIISTTIMGVGAAKRVSSVKWALARSIVLAWVVTIPASAAMGALLMFGFKLIVG